MAEAAETQRTELGFRSVLVTVHHPMSWAASRIRVLTPWLVADAGPSRERACLGTQVHLTPSPSRRGLIMTHTGGGVCTVRERELASGVAEVSTALRND